MVSRNTKNPSENKLDKNWPKTTSKVLQCRANHRFWVKILKKKLIFEEIFSIFSHMLKNWRKKVLFCWKKIHKKVLQCIQQREKLKIKSFNFCLISHVN